MASPTGYSSPLARENTPARASTSSLLSARSTPVLPPASQTYEPQARAILKHRLSYGILLPSTLPVWASASYWVAHSYGGFQTLGVVNAILVPLLPSTLVVAFLAWALGVLPVVVMRKAYLTAIPTHSASPSQRFRAAYSKSGTLRSLLVYLATSSFATLLHVLALSQKDKSLSVFVKSRKHPYYINGQFVFLALAQVVLATTYHFRNVLLDRLVVQWTRRQVRLSLGHMNSSSRILHKTLSLVLTTVAFTVSVFSAYLFAFALSRSFLLPILFNVPVLSTLLRPFFAHYLRGPINMTLFLRHLPLVWRTLLLGLTTVGSWEFAEQLFDEKVQEPLAIASRTADPSLTLVSAISSSDPDPYFKYFAFEELREFSADDTAAGSARRTALFGDQKYNPSLWSVLVRESLLFLGKDYQLLLRRGKAAPPPAAAPIVPQKPKGPDVPATPLIRKVIFKTQSNSPIASVLDSFAADGALTQVMQTSVDTTTAHLPELFKAIESPVAKAKAEVAVIKSEVAPVVNAPARTLSFLKKTWNAYTPRAVSSVIEEVTEWWRRERLNKVVESALPHREVDALIIEVLSRLVCASLSEDRYGIVQRDIPRILESLLSFLSAVETYQTELAQRAPPAVPDESGLSEEEQQARAAVREEVTRAGAVLAVVGDAAKEGVIRVVRTFGGKLGAFRFPPHLAQQLQGYVDYN
ncbi:hypothetical protein FA95DRAFT_1485201 [Auriscalpium vulgare]|uniref:Uncharacterized protein n=1 Tax=Auriscalpium vulgare TaxID=40419 RepID=A0ACB8S6L0_9AGAM|nr:hypothetical protein FA95DRAFT_1485201 [Auriscalpium vulgare]